MAKISTRKPTTLIHVDRSRAAGADAPIEQAPIEQSESPKPATKREPVRSPRESEPQVAEAKTAAPHADGPGYRDDWKAQFGAIPKASQPTPPPASDLFKRIFFASIGLVFLAALYFRQTHQNQPTMLSGDEQPSALLLENDSAREANSNWKNEEPGLFSRPFRNLCLGYAKSDGCSDEPLHPFVKATEEHGIELKFAKEPDHKVIEQTIEYRSKRFSLGK